MSCSRFVGALTVVFVLTVAAVAGADVRTDQKTQVKFEGMLGTLSRMFAGKAMGEGVVNTVAVKGNRKASVGGDTGEIVDLDEEKIYSLDFKRKTYRVLTFEQFRRQMEENMKKAEAQMKQMEAEKPPDAQQPAKEFEMDFAVTESGQKKAIAGHDCREVVSTLTMREKGKTLEQSGGMVITSNIWLAPRVPALQELVDFDVRYAQKLMGPGGMAQLEQMMAAFAMYPGLKEAMMRSAAEMEKLDGTALLTLTKIESVASPEQTAQRQKAGGEDEAPASSGGLGGFLAKKMMKKKVEPPPDPAAPNRQTFMTSSTEVLKIATEVAAADVAIPAGFRERGKEQ